MSEAHKTQPEGMARVAPLPFEDRRSRRRAKTYLPVYVRPSEARYEPFEDVRTTLNATSDSLYFTTWRQDYRPGMRLLVTFPYSPVPAALNVDYVAEVIRVDQLTDGSQGVAVRLLTIIHVSNAGTPNAQDDLWRK